MTITNNNDNFSPQTQGKQAASTLMLSNY